MMALRNVANLLQAAGSNTANIVRCVVYLKNMADFAAMNQAYAHFFGRDAPARTTVAVSALPKDALIENRGHCHRSRRRREDRVAMRNWRILQS
jgi:enamine deaminase RidA (YjgF/YER057c/UK114 family)